LAASFARTHQRSPGLASAAAAAAASVGLQHFSPTQLANLLWALTSMRLQDRALLVRRVCVCAGGVQGVCVCPAGA